MHVAYIHMHFATPSQATGTRSYEFARRLIESGHKVTMIAGGQNLNENEKREGRVVAREVDDIEVRYVNVSYNNSMGGLQRWLAFSKFASTASKIAAVSRADLVFATSTPLNVGKPGMEAAQRLGVPFVFEVRDIWPKLLIDMGVLTNPLAKWLMRRMEVSFYKAARHIVILAPGMRDHIVASGGDPDRITFVPNSCDLELFKPDNPPANHPTVKDQTFRLVFAGAHGRANGLDAVLDATAELKKRGVSGVRFVFIGSGGLKNRLKKRAVDEGLEELIAFYPPVPKRELANILAHVDVGMQILSNVPSFYNGTSPNKFFDYIASGLPVINNYPGWLAELIEQNDCGVVVPPDDPAAFADAVVRMRDNPDDMKRWGANSRVLAEREFSRDLMGRRFVETLEEMLAEGAT